MKSLFASLLPGPDRGWKSTHTPCGLPTCQNRFLIRSVRSGAGIAIDQAWYCSVECFAVAARQRLSASMRANVVEMPHVPRRSIGLLLVSKGFLTSEQLQFGFEQSHSRGETLEAALVRLGLASERQITAARAAQWGRPVLGQEGIGQRVEVDVPPTLLDTYSAVPLHSSTAAKRLLLGFVYRVEHSLLNSLEQITGLRAEPCFITPTDRAEQLRHLTGRSNCEEIVFDDPYTPTQMANNVAAFALEVDAREARFAHCRNFIWARLNGKSKKLDVLFRANDAKQGEGAERVPVSQHRLRVVS